MESGRANPTISTIWAIADALNVPFGALVDSEREFEIEESGVSVRLIERLDGSEIYLMRLRPKGIRRAEPHPKGVREHVFVVRGKMLVGPLSSPKLVRAFEVYTFEGDRPHVYIALEDPALALVVVDYGEEVGEGEVSR